MPGEPQFEKDIAALRSHVIDGIEDLKSIGHSVDFFTARSALLLKWILVGICLIAVLLGADVIHHW